jgi:hypothetical protein
MVVVFVSSNGSPSAFADIGADGVLRQQCAGLLTVTALSARTAASCISELTLPTLRRHSTSRLAIVSSQAWSGHSGNQPEGLYLCQQTVCGPEYARVSAVNATGVSASQCSQANAAEGAGKVFPLQISRRVIVFFLNIARR